MTFRSRLIRWFSPIYSSNPRLWGLLKLADTGIDSLRNSVAQIFPQLIRPEMRSLFISLTANCNLRCQGCRYGRDFMPGQELSWPIVRDLLTDAKALNFDKVRLYGGEPLLHKDLVRIVEHSSALGLKTWVTTNGVLLKSKIDELFAAGLRKITVGFYGIGQEYDRYVQQQNSFKQMEAGIAYVREKYDREISIFLDWLLMRPTSSLTSLHGTFRFAERYNTPIGVNLIHYSLPYFTTGENGELQFAPNDREAIIRVVTELLHFKENRPDLIFLPSAALRSIPDWLIKGADMRVPCHSYRLVWVGADGTVQMCYVTFNLGNLHNNRLSELVFSPEHRRAALDAFSLHCPNCHCDFANRTLVYRPTRHRYALR